jgi:hypothetical protein
MRKTLSIFILMSVLSCQTNEKPKGVMTEAQLSALLVDVYLAEAKVDAIPKVKDSTIRYFLPFEEKLLKERGIADSVLRITYSYYMSHPKELEQIYDSVIDSLVLREQRATKAQTELKQNIKVQ